MIISCVCVTNNSDQDYVTKMFVSVGAIIHYKISIPKHNILNFTFVVFVSRLLLAIFAPIKELFSAVITFLITTIPILCKEG